VCVCVCVCVCVWCEWETASAAICRTVRHQTEHLHCALWMFNVLITSVAQIYKAPWEVWNRNNYMAWCRSRQANSCSSDHRFYITRIFTVMVKKPRHGLISWVKWTQATSSHTIPVRFILILSSHLYLYRPSNLLPSVFPAKILFCFISHVCYILSLDIPTLTWWRGLSVPVTLRAKPAVAWLPLGSSTPDRSRG
jgi:hypothetical protein